MLVRKLKMKPVELFECENIHNSDIFAVNDCATGEKFETDEFEAARVIALDPDPASRRLVYAYNKKNEEVHGASRVILLTKKNLSLYDEWRKSKGI